MTVEEVNAKLQADRTTLRHALASVVYEDDAALDFPMTGDEMQISVVCMHRGRFGYAAFTIPQCNITDHADWLARVFTPMRKAIVTEQTAGVVN